MMVVWFAVMIVLSSMWVIWFLRYPFKDNAFNLQNSNIALGKQKKAELQNDLKQGLIDDTLFAQAQDDIAQTLAQELSQSQQTVVANNPVPIWLVATVVVFIGALSLGIYQSLSPKNPVQVNTQSVLESQITSLGLEGSAVKLQNYLLEQPGNADAWQMLGLTYFELGQLDESLQAYEKAYQLNPKNPRLLVEYASSIAIKNDNDFSGRPIELVKQALELEPNAPDALYMAGLYAVSQQDFKLAELLWRKALSALTPGSAEYQVLLEVLAELSELRGEAAFVPTSEPIAEFAGAIQVNVTFSEQILEHRSGEDYVMVYAKAAVGRPMPIAIVKTKLKDFTGQVVLNDSNSVIPSNTLSQASDVLIVVRLSKTGAAFRQADDIQVTSEVVHVVDNPIVDLQVK